MENWPHSPTKLGGLLKKSEGSIFGSKWGNTQQHLHSEFDFEPFEFNQFQHLRDQMTRVLKNQFNVLTGKLPDKIIIWQRYKIFG